MNKSVVVYWLIPAKPERELFCALIRILAERFDAPVFEPHLTLYVGKDRQSPKKVFRQLIAAPVRLRVRDIAYSTKFTKALFVRLKARPALSKLAVKLGSSALPDPHMSLIYKKMPARIKKELTGTIKLPFRSVTFDAIKAVRCTSPTTTAAEVRRWRVVATRRLSG